MFFLTNSTKSVSNSSHPTQFKYSEFSLSNSKVKFLGAPRPSRKKGEYSFDSPSRVSSEEMEHIDNQPSLRVRDILSL